MTARRVTTGMMAGVIVWSAGGCASLEELKQVQMAQRNLEREKAALEQELYDVRTSADSMRAQNDSLEQQLAVKDQLIGNLTTENDGLEEKFRTAQSVLEKIADSRVGDVQPGAGKLPGELDAALRRFADENPSTVTYDSARGALKWHADLVFAFASDVVKESAAEPLRRFSEIMSTPAARDFDIIVVGHTDDVPVRRTATLEKHPTNTHLSVHRSIAVAKMLQQFGVPAARIGVMGFGAYRPIAPNDSEENRSRNRRVEMYIVPAGSFSVGAIPGVMTFTGQAGDATK